MPAFFNGVFGHKPSPRMVSNLGQFPVNCTEAAELMLSTGPICRYAVDLTLMLKVINRLLIKYSMNRFNPLGTSTLPVTSKIVCR